MLHKSVVVSVPARPSVRAGFSRVGVGVKFPAPHGIRRPDPASGEGKLSASVQQKNDAGSVASGSLSSVVRVVVGVAAGSAVGSLAGARYLKESRSASYSGAGTLAVSSHPKFDRTAYLDSPGTLEASVYEQYEQDVDQPSYGYLTFDHYAKFVHSPPLAAVGALTAAATAPGATYAVGATTAGAGSLAAKVGVADDAQLAGDGVSGILEAEFATKFGAAWNASGALAATGVAMFDATTYGSGQGELSAHPAPKIPTAAAGSGVLDAVSKVNPGGAASGSGTLSGVVQTAVAMGMDKSGSQTRDWGSYAQVTGFVARTGYPGTNLVGNTLVASTTQSVSLTYSARFTAAGTSSNVKGARVKVNGTVVHTTQASGTGTPIRGATFTQAINAGDVITLEAIHTSVSNQTVQATDTFLYFDV